MQKAVGSISVISWAVIFSATVGQAAEIETFRLYAHTAEQAAPEAHQHSQDPAHSENNHEHGSIEVPANQPMPTVNLVVHPDQRQGWNLEVQVTNFKFAPEQVNQATGTTAEGHAHLYIDGIKITRLYSNWYYLESLAPGSHEIAVSLNTNTHETLLHDGQPIQSTVVIDVPPAPH
jgi:hypothetical protein